MLKHHNYAVKAHYNYSVTQGVFKRKSISPLDVSVWLTPVPVIEPEVLWTHRDFGKIELAENLHVFFKLPSCEQS